MSIREMLYLVVIDIPIGVAGICIIYKIYEGRWPWQRRY